MNIFNHLAWNYARAGLIRERRNRTCLIHLLVCPRPIDPVGTGLIIIIYLRAYYISIRLPNAVVEGWEWSEIRRSEAHRRGCLWHPIRRIVSGYSLPPLDYSALEYPRWARWINIRGKIWKIKFFKDIYQLHIILSFFCNSSLEIFQKNIFNALHIFWKCFQWIAYIFFNISNELHFFFKYFQWITNFLSHFSRPSSGEMND